MASSSMKKLQQTLAHRDAAYLNILKVIRIEPARVIRGSFLIGVEPGGFVSPSGKVVSYSFSLGLIDKTGKITIYTPAASHPRDYRAGAQVYLEKAREKLFEEGKLEAPSPKHVGYLGGYRDKVRTALMSYVRWPEMDFQKAQKLLDEYAAKIQASWAVHKNPSEVAKDIWEIEKESKKIAKHEAGGNPRTSRGVKSRESGSPLVSHGLKARMNKVLGKKR